MHRSSQADLEPRQSRESTLNPVGSSKAPHTLKSRFSEMTYKLQR